jgi:PDZ domain
MSAASSSPYRTVFLVAAVALVVIGILSAMDVGNQTYVGYFTNGDNRVTLVEAGSPAAAAGMQVGDVLASVNGVDVADTKGFINMHRAAVGATWPHVVTRNGQSMTLQVTMAPLPTRDMLATRAATLLGFCFLAFTLWAYVSVPGTTTTVLAVFGLCFGFGFLGVPYFESAAVRNAVSTLVTAVILIGMVALVQFLLNYPERSKFLERSSATKILYWPAILVALANAVFAVVQPASTSTVNVFFRTLFAVTFGVYFVVAIVVLLRRFLAATAQSRAEHGMGLMLLGAIVGLGPLLVVQVLTLLVPSVGLPDSQFYFLFLGLIPITFSIAAVRGLREGVTG